MARITGTVRADGKVIDDIDIFDVEVDEDL
jgi:hypothetical protein